MFCARLQSYQKIFENGIIIEKQIKKTQKNGIKALVGLANLDHHPLAAEQATTRLLHALRSLASVAIWYTCKLPSSYPNNR